MNVKHQLGCVGIHFLNVAHVAVPVSMVVNRNAELERTVWHLVIEKCVIVHHCHPMEHQVLRTLLRPFLESLNLLEHRKGVARVLLIVGVHVHVDPRHVQDQTDLRITLIHMGAVYHIHQIQHIQNSSATGSTVAAGHDPIVNHILCAVDLILVQLVDASLKLIDELVHLTSKGDAGLKAKGTRAK